MNNHDKTAYENRVKSFKRIWLSNSWNMRYFITH